MDIDARFSDETIARSSQRSSLVGPLRVVVAARVPRGMDLDWLRRLEAEAAPDTRGEVKSTEILRLVDSSPHWRGELERALQDVSIVLLDIFLHLEDGLAPVLRHVDPTASPREALCRFIREGASAHHEAAQRVLLLAKQQSFEASAAWHLLGQCRPLLRFGAEHGPLPSFEELQRMKGRELTELRVRLSVAFADAFDPVVQATALEEWVHSRFRPQDFVAAAALAEKVMEDPICYDEPSNAGAFARLEKAHLYLRDVVMETSGAFQRSAQVGELSCARSSEVRGIRAADVAAAFARRQMDDAGLPTRAGARLLRRYFRRVLLNDELTRDE